MDLNRQNGVNHRSVNKPACCHLSDLFTDMIFSTVHKAKGLEFNTVKLTDDFNVGLDFVTGLSSQ